MVCQFHVWPTEALHCIKTCHIKFPYLHHVLFIIGDIQRHIPVERDITGRSKLISEGLEPRLVKMCLSHGSFNVISHQLNVEDALVDNVVSTNLT